MDDLRAWPCPRWAHVSADRRLPLRFVWDDTRASRDFTTDPRAVVASTGPLSVRARMALCIALYEWVRCRFEGLHDDPVPHQFAAAAWVASIDPRAMPFFELERDAWVGPVRGPLWCAITWLRAALADGDAKPHEVIDGLQYLTRLAFHVAPDPSRLTAWLQAVLPRLLRNHPHVPDDPFTDLLGRRPGDHRGTPVGEPVFDPGAPYDPSLGQQWCDTMLAGAAAMHNPFLVM